MTSYSSLSRRTWKGPQSLQRVRAYLPSSLLDGVLVFNLYLVAIFFSRTFEFFPGGKTLVNSYMFASNAVFMLLAILLHPTARNFIVAMATFLFVELMVFILNFDLKLYAASLASFPALFSCGLLALYARRYSLERAVRMLFTACVCYMLTFLYFHYSIDAYQIALARAHGLETGSSIMIAHGVDSTAIADAAFRVAVSAIHLAFGFFYALEQFRTRRSLGWLGVTLLFGFCIAVSDFRFMMAAIVLTSLVSFVPIAAVTKLRAGLAFVIVTIIGSAILALLSINVYGLLQSDATGLVRFFEADTAINFIRSYPLLGTGLYGTAADLIAVYGNSVLAPSDIGYLGELLQFGLVGLLLLLGCNVLTYRFVQSAQEQRIADIAIPRSLISVFLFTVIMEVTSTFLWEEGGALLLALSVAYLGPTARARSRRTRPATLRISASARA